MPSKSISFWDVFRVAFAPAAIAFSVLWGLYECGSFSMARHQVLKQARAGKLGADSVLITENLRRRLSSESDPQTVAGLQILASGTEDHQIEGSQAKEVGCWTQKVTTPKGELPVYFQMKKVDGDWKLEAIQVSGEVPGCPSD